FAALSQPLPQLSAWPSYAGRGLQRVGPSRRGAGGGRRSPAAESAFLIGSSQAAHAHQRPSGLRASSDRAAQSGAEVKSRGQSGDAAFVYAGGMPLPVLSQLFQ